MRAGRAGSPFSKQINSQPEDTFQLFTLPLGIAGFSTEFVADTNWVLVGSIFTTIPRVLLVFFFPLRHRHHRLQVAVGGWRRAHGTGKTNLGAGHRRRAA